MPLVDGHGCADASGPPNKIPFPQTIFQKKHSPLSCSHRLPETGKGNPDILGIDITIGAVAQGADGVARRGFEKSAFRQGASP